MPACLPLTLGHEIGHNQGLCHNREETGCQSPSYPYGFGYARCNTFRTVMSYSLNLCGSETRVYNFANPKVSWNGYPTGIAHDTDPTNSSEAWRALNDSAADVASWRGCSATSAPAVPTLNTVVAISHSRIDVTWTDTANNESGFTLERSTNPVDPASWSAIAGTSSSPGTGGTVTYSDTGLDAATEYGYRVSAINCFGASAATEPKAVTTPALPPDPPASVTATVVNSTTVTIQWAAVADATSYTVGRSQKASKGNKWSAITTISSNIDALTSNDSPGTGTFRYYVMSVNTAGSSNWSSPAEVSVSSGSSSGGGGGGKCNPRKQVCS
jgi:hypothetical protein